MVFTYSIHVFYILNLQHFPLFSLNETDMNSVGIRWSKYVSRFDNFLVAMNITTDPRKRALSGPATPGGPGGPLPPHFLQGKTFKN